MWFFMKANTLCISSIYIHALVIIGILTGLIYLAYLLFITPKLSKIKKNRTCVEPITPHLNKLQEKGNSRPQEIIITVISPSFQDLNQNTEVNDYNKTTQGQTSQAYEPAKSIVQQINSNHLQGKEELRKLPKFHNSSFRELDAVKFSDLGGIHMLHKQSYVS